MLQILPIQVLFTDSSIPIRYQQDADLLSNFRNLMKAGLNVR